MMEKNHLILIAILEMLLIISIIVLAAPTPHPGPFHPEYPDFFVYIISIDKVQSDDNSTNQLHFRVYATMRSEPRIPLEYPFSTNTVLADESSTPKAYWFTASNGNTFSLHVCSDQTVCVTMQEMAWFDPPQQVWNGTGQDVLLDYYVPHNRTYIETG
jgi:hypothetical protein